MPTAVVTGSNSGIGHAFAEILVREVVSPLEPSTSYHIQSDRSVTKSTLLDMMVGEKMESLGCLTHQCDLSSEGSIRAFAKRSGGKRVDFILKIAGISRLSRLDTGILVFRLHIADAVHLTGIMAPPRARYAGKHHPQHSSPHLLHQLLWPPSSSPKHSSHPPASPYRAHILPRG